MTLIIINITKIIDNHTGNEMVIILRPGLIFNLPIFDVPSHASINLTKVDRAGCGCVVVAKKIIWLDI